MQKQVRKRACSISWRHIQEVAKVAKTFGSWTVQSDVELDAIGTTKLFGGKMPAL